jgi:hypothetical protein
MNAPKQKRPRRPDLVPGQGLADTLTINPAGRNVKYSADKRIFESAQWEGFFERAAIMEIEGKFRREANLAAAELHFPADMAACRGMDGYTAGLMAEYLESLIADYQFYTKAKFSPGSDILAEYTRRGIRLMPCVPCDGDPHRYRPIAGNKHADRIRTADIYRISQYRAGTLWPYQKIELFRFTPADHDLAVLDIDCGHRENQDGIKTFFRIFKMMKIDPLPPILRDLRGFPSYADTPSGGVHLYFRYKGPPLKKHKIADVEIFHTDPITAAGSRKYNGEYVLHGNIDQAPPLPPEILALIHGEKGGPALPKPRRHIPVPDHPVFVRGSPGRMAEADKEMIKGRLRDYLLARGIAITKKDNKEYISCLCHSENTPSMLINTSGKYKNTLHCFGCGASLDIFGAARVVTGIGDRDKDFPRVIAEVESALGIPSMNYRREAEGAGHGNN